MSNLTTFAKGTADDPSSAQDRVRQLQTPDAYPDDTTSVELIETHISWVFLTDRFAYKLKKPVQFEFLDFSTPELRHEACRHEVALNRRLSPGVYLGVIPLARTSLGTLTVDAEGEPVDWLVKMKRLPADAALDVMIRDGTIAAPAIERLAETLSDFYQNLPPVTLTVEDYRHSIERHVAANRNELAARTHHLDRPVVQRVHSAQLCVLRLTPELLDDRVRNGRIVEGHGDLRPEHVYFSPSPLVIDCIEFNREFRVLDVIDELAFLGMECDFLGADGIAAPIFQRYFDQSGDSPPQLLIDFYRTYRACVRAKVCALRAEQLADEARSKWIASASKYLSLADRYSRSLAKPLLVLVRGLPGTGKSTIAETLSEQLGFELVQTDAVRQELFGPSQDRINFNEGRYRPENRLRVYDNMHERAEQMLAEGLSVVLDGTYLSASLRQQAAECATQHGIEFLSVHCRCQDEIALQRINTRGQMGASRSETRPEFFAKQREANEPDPPGQPTLVVDTSASSVEPIRQLFAEIQKRLPACRPVGYAA
jgi:aminoglycoside phosphotransferase family enzyme/predicted kinase